MQSITSQSVTVGTETEADSEVVQCEDVRPPVLRNSTLTGVLVVSRDLLYCSLDYSMQQPDPPATPQLT